MAASTSTDPLPFELLFPETGASLRVAAFTGREQISRPFRLNITATAPGGDIDYARRLVGARATFVIHQTGEIARRIHGYVARAAFGSVVDGEARVLELCVMPRLHRLGRRRARRIFQDRTTVDIAGIILGEHDLPLRSLVARALMRRAYCVQYDETDLEFLARLFAEEGIFYSFEHDESASRGDVLVLADRAKDASPIDGDPRLVLYRGAGGAGSVIPEDAILTLSPSERARPRSARSRGYDFRRPQMALEDEASVERGAIDTLDEYEGSYEDDLELRPAGVRLEQARARVSEARVETYCKRLAPMRRFALDDEGAFGLAGEFLITRVDHEGYGGDVIPAGRARYQNRARLIPAGTPPRSRWAPQRPRQVAEVATVVGPTGAEIHTDEYGRIKVQFGWDREGRGDDRSTCWLRVAQAWAGAGWGALFIPRVGMEVVVTFLGGDLDRPLVTGCVYNATHPPPFPLPEHATRSGLRTRSTPGGVGSNEISFEDAIGGEQLYIHAQRDYEETIENNQTSRVYGARITEVSGGASDKVGMSATVAVVGDRAAEIGGSDKIEVGLNLSTKVKVDYALEVKANAATTVEGNHALEVRGNASVTVGNQGKPGYSDHYVYGSASFGASDRVVVRAEKSLTLECGESVVEILPEKIVLRAPTIELSASKAIECTAKDGPSVTLGDHVEILTKKFKLFTEEGALEVDNEFKAQGKTIKLGYDPSRPSKEKEEKAPETKPFTAKLTNYLLEPFANKKYHLMVEGLRFEGETDAEGTVKQDIPKAAKQVVVRLFLDEYPEGRQRLYTMKLLALPPSTTPLGAKVRLKNMGYFTGELSEKADGAMREAVAEFQADHKETHGLDPTGELDEGTAGALEEVHGS